jgi:hypothetical protein
MKVGAVSNRPKRTLVRTWKAAEEFEEELAQNAGETRKPKPKEKQKNTEEERKLARRMDQKKHRESEKGQKTRKEYSESEHGMTAKSEGKNDFWNAKKKAAIRADNLQRLEAAGLGKELLSEVLDDFPMRVSILTRRLWQDAVIKV